MEEVVAIEMQPFAGFWGEILDAAVDEVVGVEIGTAENFCSTVEETCAAIGSRSMMLIGELFHQAVFDVGLEHGYGVGDGAFQASGKEYLVWRLVSLSDSLSFFFSEDEAENSQHHKTPPQYAPSRDTTTDETDYKFPDIDHPVE